MLKVRNSINLPHVFGFSFLRDLILACRGGYNRVYLLCIHFHYSSKHVAAQNARRSEARYALYLKRDISWIRYSREAVDIGESPAALVDSVHFLIILEYGLSLLTI